MGVPYPFLGEDPCPVVPPVGLGRPRILEVDHMAMLLALSVKVDRKLERSDATIAHLRRDCTPSWTLAL